MSKLFKVFLIPLFTLLFVVTLINIKVNASGDAFNIITNPGADMTSQVGINWHTLVEGTYVEYTKATDASYSNATKVEGECVALDFGDDETINANISGYNKNTLVCGADLNNLEPDTEYIYRVGKSAMSENYTFKTAAGSGTFDFIFMADPQFYSTASAKAWYNNMDTAYSKNDSIDFSVIVGDVINMGATKSEWDLFFNSGYQQKGMMAATTGNHEYYYKGGVPLDARFYNVHYNNPDNGSESVKNSSYYFKYNNTLFISIDSEAKTKWAEQKEWFANVVRNNAATFIVVIMHTSVYGGDNGSNADYLRSHWLEVFDKYSVDLVLTGHDHIYSRSKKLYNDSVVSDSSVRGTYYVIGGVAGDGTKYSAEELDKSKSAKYFDYESAFNIVTITESTITLKYYDSKGNNKDQLVIAARRRPAFASDLNQVAFMDSLSVTTNNDNLTRAKLAWDGEAYGNIASIDVYNGATKLVNDYYPICPADNNIYLENLTKNSDYEVKVVVKFADGAELEKTISFNTRMNLGTVSDFSTEESTKELKITWKQAIESSDAGYVNVYVNGELLEKFNSRKASCTINYPLDKVQDINTFEVKAIVNATNEEVVVYSTTFSLAKDPVLTLDKTSVTLEEGKEETVTATVDLEGYTVEWKSSDESIATVENGKIVAKKAGTAVITAQIKDTEVKAEINLTVTAKPLPQLTVSKDAVTLEEGKEETVTATVDLEGYTVEWKSSDESIATVENGKIVAKKAGTAVITAQIKDTEVKAEINVTVNTAKAEQPKSGCNAATIIPMLAAFGLVAVFLRRKRLF